MFKPNVLATVTATVAVLATSISFAQELTPAPEIDNFVSTKTRAEVVAETKAAAQSGLIARNHAEIGRLPEQSAQSTKSRAQVRAETKEAARLGLVHHGEMGAPQATPEQLRQIRAAGLRAVEGAPQVAGR